MGKKDKAWIACSKYIRLRDSIAWNKANYQDITGIQPKLLLCKCVTCSTIKIWPRMDAGHFLPRGSRGQSGVYFDVVTADTLLEFKDLIIGRFGKVKKW